MDYKKYKSRARHPKTLIRVYRLFLMGLSDEEMINEGFTAVEVGKIKKFHENLIAGKVYSKIGQSLGIGNTVSRNMFTMFHEWKAGKPLSFGQYTWRKEHPRIMMCFSMLIEGATDEELREKCTVYEIQKAKEFLRYANSDMLSSSISIAIKIPRSTVKSLLKIYRDKSQAEQTPVLPLGREGMTV